MIEHSDEIGYPAERLGIAGETYEDETPTAVWADFRSSAGTRSAQLAEIQRAHDEETRIARLVAVEQAIQRERERERRRNGPLPERW